MATPRHRVVQGRGVAGGPFRDHGKIAAWCGVAGGKTRMHSEVRCPGVTLGPPRGRGDMWSRGGGRAKPRRHGDTQNRGNFRGAVSCGAAAAMHGAAVTSAAHPACAAMPGTTVAPAATPMARRVDSCSHPKCGPGAPNFASAMSRWAQSCAIACRSCFSRITTSGSGATLRRTRPEWGLVGKLAGATRRGARFGQDASLRPWGDVPCPCSLFTRAGVTDRLLEPAPEE
ncbi:unnamed protein product [Lampetra fluviatilis]